MVLKEMNQLQPISWVQAVVNSFLRILYLMDMLSPKLLCLVRNFPVDASIIVEQEKDGEFTMLLNGLANKTGQMEM